MPKAEFRVTFDLRDLIKYQGKKIHQLRAERDAARAQVDKDGAMIRFARRALEQAGATHDALKTTIEEQASVIQALERRVEGLTTLNSRLNADLDEVCQELARAKEEIAVLREELADHHRFGSDRG